LQAGSEAAHVARAEGARCDIIISTGASKLAYPADNSSFATGSVVTCEITIELEGYWVQICRTLSVGKPSDSQKRLFSASQRAYEAGVAASVPGNSPATVWQRISDSLRQDDCYQWSQYGLGHGVGLDLPELYPVERDCLTKLKHNMILVLHPALWAPKENAAAWTGGPIAVGHPHPLQLDTPQSEIIEV
jgi:Xaa-Pro aminopeptidase